MSLIPFIIALFPIGIATGQSLIGYDCGGRGLNVSRVSLLNVGECNLDRPNVKAVTQPIMLLQTKKYTSIKVTQCKIHIHRVITQCGMFSHGSPVAGGILEYLEEVTRDECLNMHTTRTAKIGYASYVDNLQRNGTVFKGITLAGKITSDGHCKGVEYAEYMVTFSDVVVQASVTITLSDYHAKGDREKNTLWLNSGVKCKLSKGECIDNAGGHTFWENVQLDDCKLETYDVLYEGNSTKMTSDDGKPLYTVETFLTSFSILGVDYLNSCQRTLTTTEHHRLFILETHSSFPVVRRNENFIPENVAIATYINAKIVYVERHMREQLTTLYYDVLYHRCILERKVIKNLLSLAAVKPDEFAYNLMGSPGYIAVVTGEVVRVIKCTAVEVTIRRPETCYLELPVLRGNVSYFLTPKTHILLRKGTEILCDGAIPSTYRVGNTWYEITPKAHHAEAPNILQPSAAITWRYENPSSLAKTGIYTEQELENLEERILFPMEQPAVLSTLAHTATGKKISPQGVSIEHFLDEKAIDKMVESYWSRLWNKFTIFGNTMAGLIGIFILFKTIKIVIDTTLQACLLKQSFGWSFKLLGGILSSVTHFLLHQGEKQQSNTSEPQELLPLHNTEEDPSSNPEPRPRSVSFADQVI